MNMVSFRFLFLYPAICFLSVAGVYAQAPVKLVWDNVPVGKNRFSVVAFKDYVSLSPEFLAETVSPEAHMELSFPLIQARWVRIRSPFGDKNLLAEPGKTYYYRVQASDGETITGRLNTGLAGDDPNILCDSVDAVIGRYLDVYGARLYQGTLGKQTVAFCDSVELSFTGVNRGLFAEYLHANLDELRMLSRGWWQTAYFKQRLTGQPFRPDNPDYMRGFNNFYKGVLEQTLLKKKLEHGRGLINNFRGSDTLLNLLAGEPFYPRNETGEGAVLVGLAELMRNKEYSHDGILFLFHELADSSRYASVRSVARNLYNKYHVPVPGDPAPGIRVEDKAGNVSEIPAAHNKPVYLCFLDVRSQLTRSELGAMVEMKKKLKDKVALVPVVVNAERSELGRLQTDLRLTFDLYRNVSFSELVPFGLKNECSCMVLSPDGKYIQTNAETPGTPMVSEHLLELAKTVR